MPEAACAALSPCRGTCTKVCGRANVPCNCHKYCKRQANAEAFWCMRKEIIKVTERRRGKDVVVEQDRCAWYMPAAAMPARIGRGEPAAWQFDIAGLTVCFRCKLAAGTHQQHCVHWSSRTLVPKLRHAACQVVGVYL